MKSTRSMSPDGAVRLNDWGVILATGPDAPRFLHGQLTQDIAGLGVGQARMAGYCSAKGRLLATFLVWRTSAETLALACSDDVLGATLNRLSMFVLRAQCRLVDARQEMALFGLAGASALGWLATGSHSGPDGAATPGAPPEPERLAPWQVRSHAGGQLIRLPDVDGLPRWVLSQAAGLPAPDLPALPADAWRALEVRSGLPRVTAATSDHFVPQMVNLELTGGVNFQKGCYPGQEVVARSQYRGTLKRRMALVMSTAAVHPGQDVFHDSDPAQPAGEVVLSAPGAPSMVPIPQSAPTGDAAHDRKALSTPYLALVSLKTELLSAEGRLTAGDAVLTPQALPYEVPSQPA